MIVYSNVIQDTIYSEELEWSEMLQLRITEESEYRLTEQEDYRETE